MRLASKLAGMTVVLLGAMTTAAMAAPAETAAATALRSGPGAGYRAVATLPPHAVLDIGKCAGNWCHARWRGVAGYVSLAALAVAAPPLVDPYADEWDTDDARDNWVRVRRNGEWIWVPHDDRKDRDDRDRNRNRNAGNDRRQNATSLRGNGGSTIWVPSGGVENNRSSMNDGGRNGGGRDGGGRGGGDGGGRGGDGGDGGGRGGGDGGGGRGR
jgi:hypothetical protein